MIGSQRYTSTTEDVNIVRSVDGGRWLVERGIDECVGIIVQLSDGTCVVHMDPDGKAPRFTQPSDAIAFAKGSL